MKPFLLLQIRPEDEASDNEYQAFLKFTRLKPDQLIRARIENGQLPKVNFEKLSGIILGGGPTNASDPINKKLPQEVQFEEKLFKLIQKIIEIDFPFLGTCYGIGALTTSAGGVVSRKYGEDVGASLIELTEAGKVDKLLAGLDHKFDAFVGHKEACEILPKKATLLAKSEKCPVQMYKIKNNVYTTQFHTELDAKGLELRINIYKDAGYFLAKDAKKLIEDGYRHNVNQPEKILENFVKIFKQKQ